MNPNRHTKAKREIEVWLNKLDIQTRREVLLARLIESVASDYKACQWVLRELYKFLEQEYQRLAK